MLITFKYKREVVEYLDGLVEKGLLAKSDDGGYYQPGEYVCGHGEVDRPDYYPVIYNDGWGIAMVRHYPPPCVRVVDLWSEDDGDMGSVLHICE